MKQLLIVNSSKALNAKKPSGTLSDANDFSALDNGAIAFAELGSADLMSGMASKNFCIALGRPNDQLPFIIPEVDINSLTITKALPLLGKAFKRKFTFPTPVKGKEYTVIIVKRGTVPHERNTWTCSIVAGTTTAATEASALVDSINAKCGELVTASVNSSAVTIVGNKIGEQFDAKFADELTGTSWAGSTDFVDAQPTIGDKAYIQNLASQCAAGKGFTDTYRDGDTIYPGYPETVEDLQVNASGSNGASTAGYAVYTLRFRVGRDSAKTRDERVWQLVHIALPITNSSYATINGILPEGKYNNNVAKAIADAEIEDKVKETSLNT